MLRAGNANTVQAGNRHACSHFPTITQEADAD